MPIAAQTLLEETKCYACYGMSIAQLLKAGLLNRILSGDSSGSGGGGGGTAAVWGGITGTLSNQTDLQAALNAKTDLYVLTFYNSSLGLGQDSVTTYLGQCGTADTSIATTYNNVKVAIPFTGTVIAVTFNTFISTVAGSNEPVPLLLNKNNGTTSAVGNLDWSINSQLLFTGLNFAVTQGDFLALQINQPNWVTNPQGIFMSANIVIQKT